MSDTTTNKLNNGLGSIIKKYIAQNGLKQSFVAEKSNLSNSHLSNVLSDRVLITQEVLNDINDALDTDFIL
jgi:transcriptional regulator with XRE-family HTH domain